MSKQITSKRTITAGKNVRELSKVWKKNDIAVNMNPAPQSTLPTCEKTFVMTHRTKNYKAHRVLQIVEMGGKSNLVGEW